VLALTCFRFGQAGLRAKRGVKVSYNWLRLMLQEAGWWSANRRAAQDRRQRERRPLVGMLVHLDNCLPTGSKVIERHVLQNSRKVPCPRSMAGSGIPTAIAPNGE
jgi:hypothetical protein